MRERERERERVLLGIEVSNSVVRMPALLALLQRITREERESESTRARERRVRACVRACAHVCVARATATQRITAPPPLLLQRNALLHLLHYYCNATHYSTYSHIRALLALLQRITPPTPLLYYLLTRWASGYASICIYICSHSLPVLLTHALV